MCRFIGNVTTIAWICASLAAQQLVAHPFVAHAFASIESDRSTDQSLIWLQCDRQADVESWTIELETTELIGAIQFELVFPESANVTQSVAGQLLTSALLETHLVAPGRLRVAVISSEPIVGRGTLSSLNFESLPDSLTDTAFRLENIKAWHQESLAAVELGTAPLVRTGNPPRLTGSSATSSIQSPHEAADADAVTNTVPTTFDRTELEQLIVSILRERAWDPRPVQLVLPHWTAFVAGAATMLLVMWLRATTCHFTGLGKKT